MGEEREGGREKKKKGGRSSRRCVALLTGREGSAVCFAKKRMSRKKGGIPSSLSVSL